MIEITRLTPVVMVFLVLPSFFSAPAVASADLQGQLIYGEIRSAALEGNPLGNPTVKPFVVYLPPGYDEHPDRGYPVVYHLHGASRLAIAGPDKFARAYATFVVEHGAPFIDQLVAEGKTPGIILVGVDGTTKDGCSYYVNSSANGNYADYICEELVPYIDAHYRTLANREGRGLLGYSAGAFGAMYLGMTRPELFGGIICLSPSALLATSAHFDAWAASNPRPDDGQMDELEIDMARAFWPNPDNPPHFFDWPFTRDGKMREDVLARGVEKSTESLIPRYAETLQRTAIYLGCGVEDWALAGARKFHTLLTKADVPHTYREYEGGHGYQAAERKQEGLDFLMGISMEQTP